MILLVIKQHTWCTVLATASGQIHMSANLYSSMIWFKFPFGAHSSNIENDTTHNPRNCTIFGWSTVDNLFNSSRMSQYITARSCSEKSLSLPFTNKLVKHFKAVHLLESFEKTQIHYILKLQKNRLITKYQKFLVSTMWRIL